MTYNPKICQLRFQIISCYRRGNQEVVREENKNERERAVTEQCKQEAMIRVVVYKGIKTTATQSKTSPKFNLA